MFCRGKFDMAFQQGQIALCNAKQQPIIISTEDISNVAVRT